MVLFLAGGLVLAAIVSYFFITAVGTLMHWLAVAGAIGTTAILFYRLEQLNPLDLGELPGVVTYASVSAVSGFVFYRFFEALVASASTGIALASVVLALVFVFNPSLVFDLVFMAGEYLGEN